MKTELANRTLWYDGVSEVKPEDVQRFLMQGVPLASLAVTEVSPQVSELNKFSDVKLACKDEIDRNLFPPKWSLPSKYKYLDLDKFLVDLVEKVERDELYEQRLVRLAQEIELFNRLGLQDILRALIYVVDELVRQRVIWGVGRGSSCSSYLLFLIGLHEVDSVRFDVPITDFIREDT